MSVEIKIPSVGESVSEVELGEWLKAEGDSVSPDETLVMLESDKATMELPAPSGGVIGKIFKKQGETALVGEVIAILEEAGAKSAGAAPKSNGAAASNGTEITEAKTEISPLSATPAPGANGLAVGTEPPQSESRTDERAGLSSDAVDQAIGQPSNLGTEVEPRVMPSAAREIAQNNLDAKQIQGSGPGGRIVKGDAQNAVSTKNESVAAAAPISAPVSTKNEVSAPVVAGEDEEVVRMTPLRRKIAQRLVEAQQTGALLTTFNEIDMSAAMELRKAHQDAFTKKYGIKLGFMSFFVKASIDALKMYPAVNAEIRGENIVYKNHFDIGVAIGGGKALVVPVLKGAQRMSFAEVELAIAEYAGKVKSGKITPDELTGGTFTITNGGIYGSLLSTPIVNAPQSGILGMHTIQERPIAKNGQVVIAPMMYIALTYDHRIVDGREAVSFLKRIKECLENPSRMLLEV
ncbi:2-oxoglutarate dehydrogenase E2 component [Abditibacterium utsteinense]|uniref:Dihydrolipoyllysine-residue succinyltransferase component of 2-oxoglutarate dehydrogenase complex n=1 Tax=Abditibacterium utsteinense TaxID=1960156 RepID=A0A2S8STK8_9BACT|nr:2-oxoglutarate dehydrogenase complex dihydrolipoyllysine-residue succinyltransferase [Abditibacterium utsteinense]PQV64079.1 2-oxoglutarate dehydrogenase E2 component [Abditibacterium utsteinense]